MCVRVYAAQLSGRRLFKLIYNRNFYEADDPQRYFILRGTIIYYFIKLKKKKKSILSL